MKKNSPKLLATSGRVLLVVIFIVVAIAFIITGLTLFKAPINISFQFGNNRDGARETWDIELSEPDISLSPERKFVENESGEQILVQKEYFAKYSGITTDTWEWTDENGEVQRKEIRSSIEWESKGTPIALELAEPEYQPKSEDEIGPPPVENARLVKHVFEGWVNDAVLWSRWEAIALFKEVPLEEKRHL